MDTQVPQEIIPYDLSREEAATIERFDRRELLVETRVGWGATSGGKAIAKAYLNRLSEAVCAAINNPPRKDRADAGLLRTLSGLDPTLVSLCILQTSLHAIAREQNMAACFLAVGYALEAECWGANLFSHNATMAKHLITKIKKRHASPKHRLRSARAAAAAARRNAYQEPNWTQEARSRAGAWGVSLMVNTLPDVFTIKEERGFVSEQTHNYLVLSEKAWGIVDAALARAVERHPVFFPSAEPPKPWDAWTGCGPVDARVNGLVTFLRAARRGVPEAMKEAIASGQAQPALDGVNTLQNVPWKINTRILDIIRECEKHHIEVPGLPAWQDMQVPERLPDVVWAAMDEDRQRFVRMRIGEIHQLNRAAKCNRIQYAEDMKVAEEMAGLGQFYTPMNCDWRGRVYSVAHFNFQREDRVRALFLFKDGEPLGEDGLYWLKVHVANCGDFNKISKRPIAERAQWCDENIGLIKAAASVPFTDTTWMTADKPFMFLAACQELNTALSYGRVLSRTYVCALPVSFDGSCSGLQHLSAMTRASEGSLVNLTPSELPQDIYENVALLVKDRVTLDLDHEPECTEDGEQVKASDRIRALARLTLDYGVDRKLVKRNVMTYAYSSKKFGMASQLQVDLMAPLAREVLEGKREEHPFAPYQDGSVERPSSGARYLASHVFEAIEAVVSKPSEAMKFLQKLARAMAHEGEPLRWVTPVGIPWINLYSDPVLKRVEMFLQEGGVSVRKQTLVAVGAENEINKSKAANGVAPNFVHALDAAHLLLVANAARREGILQIATVHDSFGCLPSRAGRFRQIIREEFLRMYTEHDVLNEVLSQATCDLTDNNRHMLPDAIEFGPLNLTEILDADFAFA